MSSTKKKSSKYHYDDHSTIPFKLIRLRPSPNEDKGVIPHRHNFYELFFIDNGGGQHQIDFEHYTVESQSLHIVPPGSVHLLRRNAFTNGYVLLFSPDFFHTRLLEDHFARHRFFLNRYPFMPVISLQSVMPKMVALLDQMQAEYQAKETYSRVALQHYLSILLLKLQGVVESEEQNVPAVSPQQEAFFQFKQLVEKRFSELHQVKDYAQILHLSPSYLNELVKKTIGKTAGSFIQERILLESKRLLWHSDLSSKEIAYRLNFEDPSYFSRLFKKKTQLTPTAFRAQIRKKYHHS